MPTGVPLSRGPLALPRLRLRRGTSSAGGRVGRATVLKISKPLTAQPRRKAREDAEGSCDAGGGTRLQNRSLRRAPASGDVQHQVRSTESGWHSS